jgi:hypothetical protein
MMGAQGSGALAPDMAPGGEEFPYSVKHFRPARRDSLDLDLDTCPAGELEVVGRHLGERWVDHGLARLAPACAIMPN